MKNKSQASALAISQLSKKLGYSFTQPELLIQARFTLIDFQWFISGQYLSPISGQALIICITPHFLTGHSP